MELDDLKENWQSETKENLNKNTQSMEQLKLILKERTTETLTGLKKKYERIISFLIVGIFLNVLINPFLHFLLGDEGPMFRITYGGLLSLVTVVVMCLVVVFFYWLKYTSLDTNLSDRDIKTTLYEKIKSLKKSYRQEIIFIITLFALLFVLARFTSQYLGNGDFLDIFHIDILLALLAALAMMCFYIYKISITYKRNIKDLEHHLHQFEKGLI